MPETVLGLPVHPLVVHATVVAVPLAALLLIGALLVPRLRTWAGPLPALVALAAVVLAPLSTASGENLEEAVGESRAIEEHAELGDMLVWWCIPMALVAVAAYLLRRSGRTPGKTFDWALTVVGVVVAVGALVQVALVGHSGAQAVWSGRV